MAKEISKVVIAAPGFEFSPAKITRKVRRVPVTAANLLALFATPFVSVPAPGSGKALIYRGMLFQFTHGTAYLLGAALTPVYHGSTTDLSGTGGVPASVLTTASNQNVWVPSIGIIDLVTNVGIDLYIPTQAFTTGTGTAVVDIYYDSVVLG